MLAIARRNAIREQLQEHKSVTITELAARLNVAKETIRRDLKVMEEDDELIRTHGGAYILEGVQNEIDVSTRRVLKTAEKEIIAQKCDALIQSGDFIFLDGSTTAWFIAHKLTARKLTVLTNSLEIAKILSDSKTVSLFVIGGEYAAGNMCFTGQGAVRSLERYFVDKCFISCRSVSMAHGLTDTNDNDATLHRVALEHARQRFLAADSSKLGWDSFSAVAPLKELDGIVMETDFSPEWKACLENNQVRMY